MAIDGHTQYAIGPFSLDREALKDPNFKPVFFSGTSKLPKSKKEEEPGLAKL
ncbi:hypothetical protein DPMN_010673 [Dreissena polymorpha]|uniref:Uncharacterized protein n=2 Tax=Dreissena polymorpha TaxID=45954 RepID=A0A9D4N2P5_DREPO|nr:hypothetical protein DPMN_010673 [Dreissena polymorpha]